MADDAPTVDQLKAEAEAANAALDALRKRKFPPPEQFEVSAAENAFRIALGRFEHASVMSIYYSGQQQPTA